MKRVYVVQVTFTGAMAKMQADAHAKFGAGEHFTNGFHRVYRTKRLAERCRDEWAASLGDAAMAERYACESWDEALMALIDPKIVGLPKRAAA